MVNGQVMKLARMKGEFVWHCHEESDELFLVLTGLLRIELRGRMVELGPGELFVVARGVEHRPCAKDECEVLLLEAPGLVNTGNNESRPPAPVDSWLDKPGRETESGGSHG